MDVSSGIIGVPNFDIGVSNRLSAGAQDPPAHVGDLTNRRSEIAVDDNEVIVGIEWKSGWVVGPFGLLRRVNQLFGKRAGHVPERAGYPQHPHTAKKLP